ncbi:MAG TPA: Rab family GTPase [Anaerolineae bacterium]|nr:Rab family GTPase [Anaerolineae bacterium]
MAQKKWWPWGKKDDNQAASPPETSPPAETAPAPAINYKICLLGSFAVGKTSLVRRFVESSFDENYLSTVGFQVKRKSLKYNNRQYQLMIWDLAGGEDYNESVHLSGCHGALVVCDLTRPDSIDAYHKYHQQLAQIAPNAQIIYLANKADLTDERQIGNDTLAQVSADLGAPYLLTSAKTGQNVEAAFELIVKQIESS